MRKLSKLVVGILVINSIPINYITTFAENKELVNDFSEVNNELENNTYSKITFKKQILENRIMIDEPKGTIDNKDIKVRGWSLNASGVKEVKIYIDGKYKDNAKIGLVREDVNKAYPGYPGGSNSGYELLINKDEINPGVHKIKVESIGNDGSIKYSETSFNITKLESRIMIDEPKGTIDNKDIKVRGWSLNASGVKEVKIYIDGKYKDNAKIGLVREDVNKAYPGYPGGSNSGYELLINKDEINPGVHKIKVESIGNDGSIKYSETSFNITKLESRIMIDEPKGTIDNKDIKVRGWSLNASGVKEVKIYIDGEYKGNAKIGMVREDVNKAYPGYPGGSNSGYELLINKDEINPGVHKIKVESIGNDGSIKYSETSFNITKLESRIMIDEPKGTIDNKDIKVRGWSLNASGVKEVKIYIDGKYKDNAKIGLVREDVNKAYPGYPGGSNSGYELLINKDEINPGNHKLKVEAIGNDNSIQARELEINIIKPEAKSHIDSPCGNIILNNRELEIRGWALNASGVKEVNVYVDGILKGKANLGISRPDVDRAYPGYPNGDKSGFSLNLDTSNLGFGKHEIKIEVIGNDNSKNISTSLINDLRIIEYNNHNYSFNTHVSKQIAKGSDMKFDSSNKYVKATEDDIRYYMDFNNFKNEKDIYQFLRLDIYKSLTSVQNLNDHLQKVLKNTSTNPLLNQGQAFINASKEYSIDPIYLVAHTLLETGYGSSALAKGYEVILDDNNNAIYYDKVINGKTYTFAKIKDSSTPSDVKTVKVYNFFGIGAIDQAAKEGGVTTAYKNGWTTPEKAIYGAAKWISQGYINNSKYNQNTLYYMRWYYDKINGNWHQYATDIGWAKKISNLMYEMSYLYSSQNTSMIYSIPEYNELNIISLLKNIFN